MRRSRPVRKAAAIIVCFFLFGCISPPRPGTPRPDVPFDTGVVRLVSATDTFSLRVEIAESPDQHRIGLSRRSGLPEDEGMIFLFAEPQAGDEAFWMYRTTIPLSIAWLDSASVIREIRDMDPCRRLIGLFCPRYRAGVSYRAAIEVNQGFFDRRGLKVGDRAILERDDRASGPGGG